MDGSGIYNFLDTTMKGRQDHLALRNDHLLGHVMWCCMKQYICYNKAQERLCYKSQYKVYSAYVYSLTLHKQAPWVDPILFACGMDRHHLTPTSHASGPPVLPACHHQILKSWKKKKINNIFNSMSVWPKPEFWKKIQLVYSFVNWFEFFMEFIAGISTLFLFFSRILHSGQV